MGGLEVEDRELTGGRSGCSGGGGGGEGGDKLVGEKTGDGRIEGEGDRVGMYEIWSEGDE